MSKGLIKKLDYSITFDTQIIGVGKQGILNLSVSNFLKKFSKNNELRFILPAIVYSEMQKHFYDMIIEKNKTYETSSRKLRNLVKFKPATVRLTKKRINNLFSKQFEGIEPEIIKPVYQELDWEEVINKSIWKIPPFEESREKGFKDSMTIKSIKEFLTKNPKKKLVFICNDEKLIRGIYLDFKKRMKSKIYIYNNIEDAESKLKLELENFTKIQIEAITNSASEAFHNSLAKEILYSIKKKFSSELSKHPIYDSSALFSGLSSAYIKTFVEESLEWKEELVNEGIANPRFISKEGHVYNWETIIVIIKEFKNNYFASESIKYRHKFIIEWQSEVTTKFKIKKRSLKVLKKSYKGYEQEFIPRLIPSPIPTTSSPLALAYNEMYGSKLGETKFDDPFEFANLKEN